MGKFAVKKDEKNACKRSETGTFLRARASLRPQKISLSLNFYSFYLLNIGFGILDNFGC